MLTVRISNFLTPLEEIEILKEEKQQAETLISSLSEEIKANALKIKEKALSIEDKSKKKDELKKRITMTENSITAHQKEIVALIFL